MAGQTGNKQVFINSNRTQRYLSMKSCLIHHFPHSHNFGIISHVGLKLPDPDKLCIHHDSKYCIVLYCTILKLLLIFYTTLFFETPGTWDSSILNPYTPYGRHNLLHRQCESLSLISLNAALI